MNFRKVLGEHTVRLRYLEGAAETLHEKSDRVMTRYGKMMTELRTNNHRLTRRVIRLEEEQDIMRGQIVDLRRENERLKKVTDSVDHAVISLGLENDTINRKIANLGR